VTTIAVLADVHGNVPAFEAVLDDALRRSPDEVLLAGDLVGRGPQGAAVVEMAGRLGWRGVRGNHEDYLLAFRRGDVPDHWLREPEWSAARWMAEELGAGGERAVARLPLGLVSRASPEVRVVHGSPCSNQEGIGRWTGHARLREHLAAIREQVLVCAHTHRPLVKRVDGRLIVNTGSVGLPFDGDWHARYALLRRRANRWDVEHRRVAWDRERLLTTYRDSGFLDAGGITARLLELEVRTARSQLVPFLDWAHASGRAVDGRALAEWTAQRGHDGCRAWSVGKGVEA